MLVDFRDADDSISYDYAACKDRLGALSKIKILSTVSYHIRSQVPPSVGKLHVSAKTAALSSSFSSNFKKILSSKSCRWLLCTRAFGDGPRNFEPWSTWTMLRHSIRGVATAVSIIWGPQGTGAPACIKDKKPYVPKKTRLENSSHQPEISTRSRCAVCNTKASQVRPVWMCCVCKVPLRLEKKKSCFQN
ncbi:hypothetical protein TNCV_2695671 [Trichonephila clavipes]|nr:hypothetical protein TNCV_2695671 [Trichonephila clavipes]